MAYLKTAKVVMAYFQLTPATIVGFDYVNSDL
jgi:hypothetical protein